MTKPASRKKGPIGKFVVITAMGLGYVLFCVISLSQAEINPDSDMRRMHEEMKRDRLEAEKTSELIKQNESEMKRTREAIKQGNIKTKNVLRELKDDQLATWRLNQSLRPGQNETTAGAGLIWIDSLIKFFKNNLIRFILIFIYAIALYLIYAVLTYEKRPVVSKAEAGIGSILLKVNDWIFTEGDFKNLLEILKSVVDPEVLNVKIPEFAEHFIKDLALTEIIYQIALAKKIEETPGLINSLPDYADFVVEQNNVILAPEIISFLKQYRISLYSPGNRPRPYADYYMSFLVLLLVIGSLDITKTFEFRSKFLLVSKLIADLGKDIAVSSVPTKLQEKIDSLVDEFKAKSEVIVNLSYYQERGLWSKNYFLSKK